MDGILRRLKIQELHARILLYEHERESHIRELTSPAPDNDRRAALYCVSLASKMSTRSPLTISNGAVLKSGCSAQIADFAYQNLSFDR